MKNQTTWDELKNTLVIGKKITGTILRHEPYGVVVDIAYGYDGLIQITDFKDDGVMTPEEYPPIGREVQAIVLGFKDKGCQVWLGLKLSQLEASSLLSK